MSSHVNTFHPTPNDVAALTWRRIAKAAKGAPEREHAERMATECEAMAQEEGAAKAESDSEDARRERLLAAAARDPEANECYCGKKFTLKAHLAKHKKACELAQIAEGEDEQAEGDAPKA